MQVVFRPGELPTSFWRYAFEAFDTMHGYVGTIPFPMIGAPTIQHCCTSQVLTTTLQQAQRQIRGLHEYRPLCLHMYIYIYVYVFHMCVCIRYGCTHIYNMYPKGSKHLTTKYLVQAITAIPYRNPKCSLSW